MAAMGTCEMGATVQSLHMLIDIWKLWNFG